jgi:adenylate kinase
VIELKVDSSILHKRIDSRIAEATARGEALRADDDPDVLKRRLEAYREQTAPLVDYYRWQGSLRSVDGMAAIPDVAKAIDQALTAPGKAKAKPKAKPKKTALSAAKAVKSGSPRKSAAAKSAKAAARGNPAAVKTRKAAGKATKTKKSKAPAVKTGSSKAKSPVRKKPAAAGRRRPASGRKSSRSRR